MPPSFQTTQRFSEDSLLFEDLQQELDAAYTYLMQRTYPSFRNYVHLHGGSDQEAEDAFQEGVVKFMGNLRSGRYTYQPGTQIRTVLFQYAKSFWIDEVRRAGRRLKESMPDNEEVTLGQELSLEDLLIHREWLDQGSKALTRLGDRCQRVIRWFYLEKWSLAKIGDALGTNEKAAKTARYECMIKLRNIFFALN